MRVRATGASLSRTNRGRALKFFGLLFRFCDVLYKPRSVSNSGTRPAFGSVRNKKRDAVEKNGLFCDAKNCFMFLIERV